MSKYYKKPHKHSFKANSGKVDYPNHKYSYGGYTKSKSRHKKKYRKYEWWNEYWFEKLCFDEKYLVFKSYRTHLDWETIEDVDYSKLGKYTFVDDESAFNYETHQTVITRKPRWRAIFNSTMK